MATLVLSAAGMALGGSIGGSVLGLSTAVVGRAIGASVGRSIDQRLMGAGGDPVSTGRLDRLRLMGASEGTAIARVFGRTRMSGQVIWATQFTESETRSGGGKGTSRPATLTYSYSISLAVALCEGEITQVGRIWADGTEIAKSGLNLTVYHGTQSQLPDPLMEAVEGAGQVPAYRGIAYVVIENLDLGQFGNRVPQFNFEVARPAAADAGPDHSDVARLVKGVAVVPGTGEYALATTAVTLKKSFGQTEVVNAHTVSGTTDFQTSLDSLVGEAPNCGSASLVVSWFGNDLRCGQCHIRPMVEQAGLDPIEMPWRCGGWLRSTAAVVPQEQGRPVYGGTPTDQSVVEAIHALNEAGKSVVFYPFVLMDQLAGNGLADPWSGASDQPVLPWRGRITLDAAQGRDGSPDGTSLADQQVADFFGAATGSDFSRIGDKVTYSGPQESSYRRFILHYAHLCAAAGGVDAFLIGSEMRGLTQIRGQGGVFVAVEALRALAAEVRLVLGADVKIGYAADWSEYHGFQPSGTDDKFFHLDALWADPEIDFVGIDNYMPLSDWRDEDGHLDAGFGSIYDLDYLRGNIEGGEGYDWYYHSPEARNAQIRTPIVDAFGEDWVWRYKDFAGWWSNPHHDRVDGQRRAQPSAWVPQSKPIWFTEVGCAAIEKSTNQPNVFLDLKSDESRMPYFSSGARDDLIQMQYLRATLTYWNDPANNPISGITGDPMIDTGRIHVWAWDARPFPEFPANSDLWSDAGNFGRGHWLNGRMTNRSLAGVVAEICNDAGLVDVDTSKIFGVVRGYSVAEVSSPRSVLQPLMLANGFDVVERAGELVFATRGAGQPITLDPDTLVQNDADKGAIEFSRSPSAEMAGRVRLVFSDADKDYASRAAEAAWPDETTYSVSQDDMPLVLTEPEAQALAMRWLAEARDGRETVAFGLPPSRLDVGPGDIIGFTGSMQQFRVERVEEAGHRDIHAVRISGEAYRATVADLVPASRSARSQAGPVEGLFLDLPLLTGDEVPYAPYFATSARPWSGSVALYASGQDYDYGLVAMYQRPATLGVTLSALGAAASGRTDRSGDLIVRLVSGQLESLPRNVILGGGNRAAIGDGSIAGWEVFQFERAELVGENTYAIRGRLRGQAGTDGIMPNLWPVGSYFVLLDSKVDQVPTPAALRGVGRHFRFGPAEKSLDGPTFSHKAVVAEGAGLRPYRVAHLRRQKSGGDHRFEWVRRTRLDGDSWTPPSVPIGEESERYQVRVFVNGQLARDLTVNQPEFTYDAEAQFADGASVGYSVEVSQISAVFGAGPAANLFVSG